MSDSTQSTPQEPTMTMLCLECDELIVMENGMMICDCGFVPNHGAD